MFFKNIFANIFARSAHLLCRAFIPFLLSLYPVYEASVLDKRLITVL